MTTIRTLTLTAFTTVSLLAAGASAATITVNGQNGNSIGTGSNGGVFDSGGSATSDNDGGGTIAQDELGMVIVGGGSVSSTNGAAGNFRTSTYTMHGIAGGAYDGLILSFEIQQRGFQYDASLNSTTQTGIRDSQHLGVDSSLSGNNNGQIQSDTAGLDAGDYEFQRLTIANVTVTQDTNNILGGLALTGGFVGLTARDIGNETGNVLVAGTGASLGTTVLDTWNTTNFREYTSWIGAEESIDIRALVGNATSQGFVAEFATVNAVPESSTYTLACVGLLGLLFLRRRRVVKQQA